MLRSLVMHLRPCFLKTSINLAPCFSVLAEHAERNLTTHRELHHLKTIWSRRFYEVYTKNKGLTAAHIYIRVTM